MTVRNKLAAATLLAMGLVSTAAYADSVTFTLTNPTVYLPSSGGTVTVDATVSALSSNGAAIFLNGDSFNITAPVILDDSDFFADFPASLAPGTSFTGDLFTLTLPTDSAFNTYLGTFTLLGGADGNASDVLGTVNVSLTTTPEPSSIVFLLTGIGALLTAMRGRQRLRTREG